MLDPRYFYTPKVKKRFEIIERTEGQPDYIRLLALGLSIGKRDSHRENSLYNKWLGEYDQWLDHKAAVEEFSKGPVDLVEWRDKTNGRHGRHGKR